MASKGQKFKKVPLEIKMAAIKEKLETKFSFSYLAKKYGVNEGTLKTWMRIYKRDNGLDIQERGRPSKEGNIDYKERYEILKKFQEYLKEVDQEKK